MLIVEHARTKKKHTISNCFMNIHEYISYASLQQTAGKYLARTLMKQPLSPFSSLLCISFCHPTSVFLRPHYLLYSFSTAICLTSPLSVQVLFPLLCNYPFLGLGMGPIFLCTADSSVLRSLAHVL